MRGTGGGMAAIDGSGDTDSGFVSQWERTMTASALNGSTQQLNTCSMLASDNNPNQFLLFLDD